MAVTKTGVPLLEVRGKIGNIVFQRFGDGLMMRERVVPEDPRTAAQLLSRALMSRVADLWHGLSDAQYAAWAAFAPENPYRTFTGLTTKWLRLHPTGTPPLLPPTGPFYGDACTVTVGVADGSQRSPTVADDGAVGGGAVSPRQSSAIVSHSQPLSAPDEGEGSGSLSVTANQPNAANVVTEILVQPMANTHRKPRVRGWVTASYLTFASGTLTQTVPLAPGAYAVAYRFVLSTTGQSTATTSLGAVKVG